MPTFTCTNCGVSFTRNNGDRDLQTINHFCKQKCYFEYKSKNSISHYCLSCGKTFKISELKRDKFCSDECQYNFTHITKKCEVCGALMKGKKSTVGKQRFCSRICQKKALCSDTEFVCTGCGKTFTKKRWERIKTKLPFCSHECRSKTRLGQIECICECGKKFTAYKSRLSYYANVYCSQECYQKFSHRTRLYFGKVDREYAQLSRKIRSTANYLHWTNICRKRDNFQCQTCHSEEGLTVHHIIPLFHFVKKHNFDYTKIIQDETLFDPTIGKTLCRSCHKKEHTRNKGENNEQDRQYQNYSL